MSNNIIKIIANIDIALKKKNLVSGVKPKDKPKIDKPKIDKPKGKYISNLKILDNGKTIVAETDDDTILELQSYNKKDTPSGSIYSGSGFDVPLLYLLNENANVNSTVESDSMVMYYGEYSKNKEFVIFKNSPGKDINEYIDHKEPTETTFDISQSTNTLTIQGLLTIYDVNSDSYDNGIIHTIFFNKNMPQGYKLCILGPNSEFDMDKYNNATGKDINVKYYNKTAIIYTGIYTGILGGINNFVKIHITEFTLQNIKAELQKFDTSIIVKQNADNLLIINEGIRENINKNGIDTLFRNPKEIYGYKICVLTDGFEFDVGAYNADTKKINRVLYYIKLFNISDKASEFKWSIIYNGPKDNIQKYIVKSENKVVIQQIKEFIPNLKIIINNSNNTLKASKNGNVILDLENEMPISLSHKSVVYYQSGEDKPYLCLLQELVHFNNTKYDREQKPKNVTVMYYGNAKVDTNDYDFIIYKSIMDNPKDIEEYIKPDYSISIENPSYNFSGSTLQIRAGTNIVYSIEGAIKKLEYAEKEDVPLVILDKNYPLGYKMCKLGPNYYFNFEKYNLQVQNKEEIKVNVKFYGTLILDKLAPFKRAEIIVYDGITDDIKEFIHKMIVFEQPTFVDHFYIDIHDEKRKLLIVKGTNIELSIENLAEEKVNKDGMSIVYYDTKDKYGYKICKLQKDYIYDPASLGKYYPLTNDIVYYGKLDKLDWIIIYNGPADGIIKYLKEDKPIVNSEQAQKYIPNLKLDIIDSGTKIRATHNNNNIFETFVAAETKMVDGPVYVQLFPNGDKKFLYIFGSGEFQVDKYFGESTHNKTAIQYYGKYTNGTENGNFIIYTSDNFDPNVIYEYIKYDSPMQVNINYKINSGTFAISDFEKIHNCKITDYDTEEIAFIYSDEKYEHGYKICEFGYNYEFDMDRYKLSDKSINIKYYGTIIHVVGQYKNRQMIVYDGVPTIDLIRQLSKKNISEFIPQEIDNVTIMEINAPAIGKGKLGIKTNSVSIYIGDKQEFIITDSIKTNVDSEKISTIYSDNHKYEYKVCILKPGYKFNVDKYNKDSNKSNGVLYYVKLLSRFGKKDLGWSIIYNGLTENMIEYIEKN